MKHTFNFKLWNNIIGFFVFVLSAAIYLSTLEPTVSFWDCGEFLSCASKLEVCHAPGNPLFLLIGRMASTLAGSDKSHVAIFINASSGLASALTIMFLFWTVTWFGRKILASTWRSSTTHQILILGAGFIGATAYAVSDSFWFSAVEAEVYAMSSLFIALIFWCILKWEESSDAAGSNRWLMLIAYLFGLGIGVHLLNLLAIPSIVVLYYLKKYPVTWKNTIKAIFISIVILGFIFGAIIPGISKVCSWFELLAVNDFGMPFNTGYFMGLIVILLLIMSGLYFSYRKKKEWLFHSIIYMSLIILGLSTYGVIVIRSHDNPPIDMNNPEDPFALQYYLNRDQYEKRDLIYGPSFASPIVDSKERTSYERFDGKYIPYPLNPDYEYDKGSLLFFPRMASQNPEQVQAYKQWVTIKGRPYSRINQNGQEEQITLPTFGENLAFFIRYQLGYMYFRYLMWNFSGRQNDILGHGNAIHGNWITGIPFIDNTLLGTSQKLPSTLKNNPGRNTYFMLPLLLGLIGMAFHYRIDKKNFIVLGLLFFFTGIAIVLYLNEVPVVPRERDYVYVGSYYAFAIWIGIGVIGLSKFLENRLKLTGTVAIIVSITVSLSVPAIMANQNWDDHDRSHRYAVLEYSRNYLESCEPNAILFTNADNDTYPLWYAQEVEGIRRDIQIILTPYLSADWYVNQLRKPSYNKPGLALHLGQDKTTGGQRTYLPIVEKIDSTIELGSFLDFVGSNDERAKVGLADGKMINYIPSHKLSLLVNKEIVRGYKFRSGIQPTTENSIQIQLKGNYIVMDHLLLLDILASNNWKRPVYFASVQEPMALGLEKYLQMDGYAYKLTPFKSDPKEINDIGIIDSEKLYQQFTRQFSFASLANPKVYLDWTHISTVYTLSLRNKFARLAETLIHEGKAKKAEQVLDKITNMLPNERVPFDFSILSISDLYVKVGNKAKGEQLLEKIETITAENLDYYQTLPKEHLSGIDYELRLNLYLMEEILKIAEYYKFENIAKESALYWKKMEVSLLPAVQ